VHLAFFYSSRLTARQAALKQPTRHDQ